MNAGHADILQTASFVSQNSEDEVMGIIFDSTQNLSFFAKGNPDTIFLITSIDSQYENAGDILTVDPDQTQAFDQRDLSRKYILDLSDQKYIDFYEDAFLYNEDVENLTQNVKEAYLSSRIVPLLFNGDYEKATPYRLSRALVRIIKNNKGSFLIVSDSEKIVSEHDAVNDLRDVFYNRVLTNREIANTDDLAATNPELIKTILYTMHFIGANKTQISDNYALFEMGEKEAVDDSITLLGVGDMMLGRYVRTLMDANGMDYPFENISHELDGVDYVFANFEGPIKEYEVATQKSISFRFKPDVIWPVKEAGINLVSIANNHALDQGWGGRNDTMKFLDEAGIHYFGHPKNEAEENAYIGQVGDKTVAFVGYDDTIFKIDGDDAAAMIKELDMIADYVIVSVHWGREYIHQPTDRKQWLAHLFVDSGADVVIGHHPHVVQTMEVYNGKPVFYSLGNFVFDQYFSQDTQEGLGIGLIINEDEIIVHLLPYAIPNSQPELMLGDTKTQFLEKFISWGEYDEDTKNSIRNAKFVLK